MGETTVDITEPRECIYKTFKDNPGPCPRCDHPLQQSTQTYLIATRRGKRMADSFFVGNDMGWFCANCPTVVINPEDVGEMMQHSRPDWDVGSEFAVLGIIDLEAVPEEKRHLPLGHDDNPIPLVEFTNTSRESGRSRRSKGSTRKRTASKRSKHRRKRRRRRR